MSQNIWQRCLQHLERELPAEDINTWIRPLQAISSRSQTRLMAPNSYIRDHISRHYLERIRDIFELQGRAPESLFEEIRKLRPETPRWRLPYLHMAVYFSEVQEPEASKLHPQSWIDL